MGESHCDRPLPSVGAVVVRDGQLLLVQRGKAPGRGQWAIPGGSIELGERIAEAVAREVQEETGLIVEVGDLAGVRDLVTRNADGDIEYHYIILDYFAVVTGGELARNSDADDAGWIPLSTLPEMDLTDGLLGFLRECGVME